MSQVQHPEQLISPEQLAGASDVARKALDQLDRLLLGRSDLHKLVMVGILSKGHILLEGLPGLGKTAMVKSLGELLGLSFSRVQFTPDLMPGDILGAHILQEGSDGQRHMQFQPGPIFTHILLADEINRASPKTQAALLEAMQERSVTLMGLTRTLPDPFFVLASQNPVELEGTYPLPEAQLDRFLFKLIVSDVSVDTLDQIISTRRRGQAPAPTWKMSAAELHLMFDAMERIFLPKAVSRYISRLVSATHVRSPEATDQVRQYIGYGASPRAGIAIAEAARAHALIGGRPTVGFEDVRVVARHVLNHRLILNYQARFDKVDSFAVIDSVIWAIDETGAKLPKDVQISPPPR